MKALKPPKRPSPERGNHPDDPDNVIRMPKDMGPRFVPVAKQRAITPDMVLGTPQIEHTVVDRTCPQGDGSVAPREVCLCASSDATGLIAAALNLYCQAKMAADAAMRKEGRIPPVDPLVS